MTRAFLLMGPTASGKSALALALAARIGGEIVNADSMQVYRDLRALTARPTPEEEAHVPHHLYGHVDAGERYSVGRWLADALATMAEVRARGATPILVGGTGLYFMAMARGLAEIPAPEPELRAELEARLAAEGAPSLHAELARRDAASAARLSPNDAPRILRALEVFQATGAPIGALQAATAPALARDEWVGLALVRSPRTLLYNAIDARFEAMLRAGALEEVRALAARGLDPALPAMKAHGAPALMACLRGEIDLASAAEIGKRDTRRYAKRQHTWIRNQMAEWATSGEADTARLADIAAALARS
jgi:tRNA dimethylallyltransferase